MDTISCVLIIVLVSSSYFLFSIKEIMKTCIFISIFPGLYDSFLQESLIAKAQERGQITCRTINPRDFCHDRHRQVDDTVYGGGVGMLIKAQPMIDSVQAAIQSLNPTDRFLILFMTPSEKIFSQSDAHHYASNYDAYIFVSGRYEGIDDRFRQRMMATYPNNAQSVSLGRFILLGGEVASMVVTEAIIRLCPGILGDPESIRDESYNLLNDMQSLEYPQYTKPREVLGLSVPDVLVSGNHAAIEQRKKEQTRRIDTDEMVF